MTHATSEDIFLGRKQEDFDLAEKLLVKHGKLNSKCVREMADITQDRLWMAECHEILKRVWNDMHVKKLEDENAKLRELTKDACTVLRNHYNKEWFDGTVFAERMRELGIEVPE